MGGITDFFFGSQKKGRATYDPEHLANEAFWRQMASSVASGTAISPDYINKIVVPSTMNQMTAGGLGRSGAMGEAVSQATLAPQVQLMGDVLRGVPSGGYGTPGPHQAGLFDWFSQIAHLGEAAGAGYTGYKQIFGA